MVDKTEVKYELTAKYKTVDEEGDNVKIENKSEGGSVEEVLENFEYPKGLFKLVKATVKKDGKEVCEPITLAPLVARQILEVKDVAVFKKKFGL